MVIKMIVMERPKTRINLIDEIGTMDDKVEKREEYIWSFLLSLLL